MEKKQINLLLVDDDPADRKLTQLALRDGLYNIALQINTADSLASCLEAIRSGNID